jgi:serine/threonine protein kinase
MSTEQARGQRVEERADIWAFGAVLYEMVTGRQAFQGEYAGGEETRTGRLVSITPVFPGSVDNAAP